MCQSMGLLKICGDGDVAILGFRDYQPYNADGQGSVKGK